MRRTLQQLTAGLLATVPLLASCSGDDVTGPRTASLEITTATSGPEPDIDGYTLSVDGGAEIPLGSDATHRQEGIEPGSHSVLLGGMSANCSVTGENPRTVSVEAGANVSVAFIVTCGATTGNLAISTTTSGLSPDPDGYTVTVDGVERGTVVATGTLNLGSIPQGDHLVGLNGVSGNCQVQGDNPRTVTVTAGANVSLSFEVSCTAPPANAGSIRIVTNTTGADPDADGYVFALDGGATQPIGTSAAVTLTNVAPGTHNIGLSGLATNCHVQGSNPRSVTVSAGVTNEVSFAITCSGANGTVEITTTTTGDFPDPDGYTVAVDNGAAQPIGANATITIPNVPAGSHQVRLDNLATNCTAAENPRQINVLAGENSGVTFSVSCTALPATSKIAFNSWDGGRAVIFVVNPDGTGLAPLTPPGEDDRQPLWSPDRTKLAFVRHNELWVMNPDGSNRERLTVRLTEGMNADFRWSPDGTMIAFETKDEMVECTVDGAPNLCPLSQIWTMRADGSNLTLVAEGEDPSWAPDSRRIAFVADDQIRIANSDGTEARTLTDQPRGAFLPAWSPAGGRIAFVTRVQREQDATEILVMNEDGTGVLNLTAGRGADTKPLWSPDGNRIAFTTFDPLPARSDNEVAVMNPDGSGRRELTTNPAEDSDATWSLEGDRLAFMRKSFTEPTAIDVYIIGVDGGGEQNLTQNPHIMDDWPSWSSE